MEIRTFVSFEVPMQIPNLISRSSSVISTNKLCLLQLCRFLCTRISSIICGFVGMKELCCLPVGLDPCGLASPFLGRNKKIPLRNSRCLWCDGSNPGGVTEGVVTPFDSEALKGNEST